MVGEAPSPERGGLGSGSLEKNIFAFAAALLLRPEISTLASELLFF